MRLIKTSLIVVSLMAVATSGFAADKKKKTAPPKAPVQQQVAQPVTEAAPAYPSHDSGSEQGKMYGGALLGLGIMSGSTNLEFGLNGGYKFAPDMGAGLFFLYTPLASTSVGTFSMSSSMMTIMPEFNYYGLMPNLYVSGKLGLAITSTSVSGTGASVLSGAGSTSNLILGAGAGYDHKLGNNLSVGGEGNLLLPLASGSSLMLNLLASVKYYL